jgi:hypothetical protein
MVRCLGGVDVFGDAQLPVEPVAGILAGYLGLEMGHSGSSRRRFLKKFWRGGGRVPRRARSASESGVAAGVAGEIVLPRGARGCCGGKCPGPAGGSPSGAKNLVPPPAGVRFARKKLNPLGGRARCREKSRAPAVQFAISL